MTNTIFRIFPFSVTSLTRPADYCLAYMDDSVFIDFNNFGDQQIQLIRISFDGYGCCTPAEQTIPLDEKKSRLFKEQFKNGLMDQALVLSLVKECIELNKEQLWLDALAEYQLV